MLNTMPRPVPGITHTAGVGVSLAFTAGYVDTVGFVSLFGLFTAHVTGNFVLIGSELATPTHGVLLKLLVFPAFIVAVAIARLVDIRSNRCGHSAALQLLIIQGLLLSGFLLAGLLATPIEDPGSSWALAAGTLGAAAMGIQNAASRLVWGSLAPTTVMTGNVTQLVIELVDAWKEGSGSDAQHRLHRFLWPVLSFGAGAFAGAVVFHHFSFFSLIVPIGIVGFLIRLSLTTTKAVHLDGGSSAA